MARQTVLLSSMKNECPYILEFVAHYLVLGFEKIIIVTNDNVDDTSILLNLLKKIAVLDYIEHAVRPQHVPQRRAFRLARTWLEENAQNSYVYVADADEFLMLYADKDIGTFLERFDDPLCISINWKFFGSNGHDARPAGLVMSNFTRRAEDQFREHRTLKPLFSFCDRLEGFTAHFAQHKGLEGLQYYYADTETYPAVLIHQKPHQDWSEIHYRYAAIHHYGIKSLSEFQGKRHRGRGAMNAASGLIRHNDEYFTKFDNNTVLDLPDPQHVEKVKSKMQELFDAAGLSSHFSPSYLGL